MRALPLSICCLAGALLAGAGTIANNLEHTRRTNDLMGVGIFVVIAAFVCTIIATFLPPRDR